MTNEEIIRRKDAELESLSPEERESYLARERAYDIKVCANLSRQFNADVRIVEGNRHVISVDGEVLGYNEFDAWYKNKLRERNTNSTATSETTSKRRTNSGFFSNETLPNATAIPSSVLPEVTNETVKSYLRRAFGYCIARGTCPTYQVDSRTNSINVSNIQWGRKLSPSEIRA